MAAGNLLAGSCPHPMRRTAQAVNFPYVVCPRAPRVSRRLETETANGGSLGDADPSSPPRRSFKRRRVERRSQVAALHPFVGEGGIGTRWSLDVAKLAAASRSKLLRSFSFEAPGGFEPLVFLLGKEALSRGQGRLDGGYPPSSCLCLQSYGAMVGDTVFKPVTSPLSGERSII